MQWWQQPFFQVALPIMVAIVVATRRQIKKLDDLEKSISKTIDAIAAPPVCLDARRPPR